MRIRDDCSFNHTNIIHTKRPCCGTTKGSPGDAELVNLICEQQACTSDFSLDESSIQELRQLLMCMVQTNMYAFYLSREEPFNVEHMITGAYRAYSH